VEPRASLVIATYNWVEALGATLRTVRAQRVLPDEVVIADDGSRGDTLELVEREARSFPVPLIHVWHEDAGFRLGAIRNKAMARARHEYLIQLDGDLLLHPCFVEDHKRFARRGWYVQGGRALLGPQLTRRALEGYALRVNSLSAGVRNRLNTIRAPWLSAIVRGPQDPLVRTRGCNMGFWRDDIVRVNGYNEEIEGWGREDSELVARLQHAGIRRRNLKFAALAWHLDHPVPDRSALGRNHAVYERVRRERRTQCERGIAQYLPGGTSAGDRAGPHL
jgi:glycosyltransferase involved in cell wall biosynthesis